MIIIPARYASTRFPGKPLADISGTSMIERVYNQCSYTGERCVVATDDQRIYDHVVLFGGEAIMTDPSHQSGTDRCAEVFEKLNQPNEIIVNVQGDEPFIKPSQITSLIEFMKTKGAKIATLCIPLSDRETLWSENTVKVVKDKNNKALFFSRAVIPYIRNKETEQWHTQNIYYKHIGLYAFDGPTLQNISLLPQSSLERAESLEQLRWMEHGFDIHLCDTDFQSPSIDTPEDLRRAIDTYIHTK